MDNAICQHVLCVAVQPRFYNSRSNYLRGYVCAFKMPKTTAACSGGFDSRPVGAPRGGRPNPARTDRAEDGRAANGVRLCSSGANHAGKLQRRSQQHFNNPRPNTKRERRQVYVGPARWVLKDSDADALAVKWTQAAHGETHKLLGVIRAIDGRSLPFSCISGSFKIDGFAPEWTVDTDFNAPRKGICDFASAAVKLLCLLPKSAYGSCTALRAYKHVEHLFKAPPEISAALSVGRPDLYWMVASAWHIMINSKGASYKRVCSATADVVNAVWEFDCGTPAWAQLVNVFATGQIVAVATSRKSNADVVVNGGGAHSGVCIAPRDKMLAAIMLTWSTPTNWAAELPETAPAPLAKFVSTFV